MNPEIPISSGVVGMHRGVLKLHAPRKWASFSSEEAPPVSAVTELEDLPYNHGMMGYQTPNIDRIAKEGAMFTSWYGQQSCTAGRAAFVTGQSPIRTGLTKVGTPGANVGLSAKDLSVAEVMKSLGYATGQFGKIHLGDRNEFLPCVHRFDEFFGNLYHLERRRGARESGLPQAPAFSSALRTAKCIALLGNDQRRSHYRP